MKTYIYKTLIEPTLLYESEARNDIRLIAAEMDFM
jgi:hypothetical protein